MSEYLSIELILTRGSLAAYYIHRMRIKLTELLDHSLNLSLGQFYFTLTLLSAWYTSIKSLLKCTVSSNTVIGGATHFAKCFFTCVLNQFYCLNLLHTYILLLLLLQ